MVSVAPVNPLATTAPLTRDVPSAVVVPLRTQTHTSTQEPAPVRYSAEDVYVLARLADERSLIHRAIKRSTDLLVSGLVLLLILVPAALLALAIRISTGGSALYTQVRAGRDGRPFRIYKFRTMVADSDNVTRYFTPAQLEQWERERKVDDDPRITRLGRFLRRTSIDELPNFLNVFLGQMSTVGPRAVSFAELDWYGTDVPRLLSVTPGVTGWWQVSDRNDAKYEDGRRQALELAYVQDASLGLDLKIIAKTVDSVFRRTGR